MLILRTIANALILSAVASISWAEDVCTGLTASAIKSSAIALPTRGATVVTGLILSTGKDDLAQSDVCHIQGIIYSVSDAPDIHFEAAFPSSWNGRALMLGGGGYNGVIPDVLHSPFGEVGPGGVVESPLQRGYVVFASDSGHQASGKTLDRFVDGEFLQYEEALSNYAGDALKKTKDAVYYLLSRYYGKEPAYLYFRGGSNGGREALVFIQRWPTEIDGAIALYPFWNAVTAARTFGLQARALAKSDAYFTDEQMTLVYESSVATCDLLDGVEDGVISNVRACAFDPGMLLCDKKRVDGCLNNSQLEVFQVFATDAFYPEMQGDAALYPGFEVFGGADLRPWLVGRQAPSSAVTPQMPLMFHYWDQLVRMAIAADPSFDTLSLDPRYPDELSERLHSVARIIEARETDLSEFANSGGKLIIYHGLADAVLSPGATALFWERMTKTMGEDEVSQFAQYYEVPGLGHGLGAFIPVWDELSFLERWVEEGIRPTDVVVLDLHPEGNGRQRPLCEYPSWPRYEGAGNPNLASSFRCTSK